MTKFYRDYLDGKLRPERYRPIGVGLMVVVVAGFVGWVYEFLVALCETGKVYMQGGNLLPWINIYAIGALAVIPFTYRLRRKPWAVFVVSMIVTGLIELVGGWLVYTIGNGTRYWNYDHGLWLIGNINGFVCLLSMVLVYGILPLLARAAFVWPRRVFLAVAISLFAVVMVDEVTNLCLKNAGVPNAMDLYRSAGWEYQEF